MSSILTKNLIILSTSDGPRPYVYGFTKLELNYSYGNIGMTHYYDKFTRIPGFDNINIVNVFQYGNIMLFLDDSGITYIINSETYNTVDDIEYVDIKEYVIQISMFNYFNISYLILLNINGDVSILNMNTLELEINESLINIDKIFAKSSPGFFATIRNSNNILIYDYTQNTIDILENNDSVSIIGDIDENLFYISVVYLTNNGDLYMFYKNSKNLIANNIKYMYIKENDIIVLNKQNQVYNIKSPKIFRTLPQLFDVNIILFNLVVLVNNEIYKYEDGGYKRMVSDDDLEPIIYNPKYNVARKRVISY